jgi:hypothetical protein
LRGHFVGPKFIIYVEWVDSMVLLTRQLHRFMNNPHPEKMITFFMNPVINYKRYLVMKEYFCSIFPACLSIPKWVLNPQLWSEGKGCEQFSKIIVFHYLDI